jgi:hypothetical protein
MRASVEVVESGSCDQSQSMEAHEVMYVYRSFAGCGMTCVAQVRNTGHGMFQRSLFGRQNLESWRGKPSKCESSNWSKTIAYGAHMIWQAKSARQCMKTSCQRYENGSIDKTVQGSSANLGLFT